MYRVTVVTDGKTYPLLNKVLKLESPFLKEVAGNSPNYLKFGIPPNHPYYDKIIPLRSELYVYENRTELFRGRSITTEEDFHRKNILTCESDLAYLCDSIMRPYEFQGSIIEFLELVLSNHNSQVEERKRFQIGRVNVVDNNNYINRSNSNYSDSLSCLRDKLVKTHGGYLRTRLERGIRYLDYVTDAGGINSQVIRYGVNLADYEKNQDATTLFTALIPTGADMEVTLPDGTLGTETVTIRDVNNGVDYVYDQDAVERYGWIFRQVKWEDVTLPENLLAKAKAYLAKSIYLSDVLKLTAVDLADMGVDIERLKTGYWTRVKSKPHGIDVAYILEERTRYLQEPGKGSISLGGTISTFSGSTAKSQSNMNAYIQQVAQSTSREINRKVENATELITGGLGGYIVIGRAEDGHPEELLIMDAPSKETAKNVIRLNKNGLGFSTTGYNGVYRNAWTIDGNLVADFITTGTMLADRIRGGTLEVGGSGLGKDGVITIRDASGGLLCQIDRNGMQFYDGQNNVTAVFSTSGVDVRKGSIKGANITLGGAENVNGYVKVLDASGNEVAILDLNGLDLQKGSIHGADITLGGAGNANGWMKLLDASGNVIFNADNTGLYIYRGIIINYSADGNSRATMTDGNFKTWRGDNVTSFLGEGVHGVVGDDGYPILFLGRTGYGTWITLNTRDGCIAGGYVNASDRDSTFAGAEFNGGVSVHSTLTAERVEAPDVFGGGTSLETLNGRCNSLGERCGSLEERVAVLEQKAGG